jgi:prophage regulatory protein
MAEAAEGSSSRRLVLVSAVLSKVPFSKATLWRKIADKTFPEPVRIGKRRVAFFQDEIDSWLEARASERGSGRIQAA